MSVTICWPLERKTLSSVVWLSMSVSSGLVVARLALKSTLFSPGTAFPSKRLKLLRCPVGMIGLVPVLPMSSEDLRRIPLGP